MYCQKMDLNFAYLAPKPLIQPINADPTSETSLNLDDVNE